MKKVLCIGSVTTDIIVRPVDALPDPGTSRVVENAAMYVGGCAANAANDLGKMGVPVGCAFKVGKDSFGSFVKRTMKKYNVNTDGIVTDGSEDTTCSILCVSSDGQRSYFFNPGSAAAYKKEDLDLSLIDQYDIIFIAGALLLYDFDGVPCSEILRYAKEKGKYTIMDTAWDSRDRWMELIGPSRPYLDLFMPSYDEAVKIAGETELDAIADCFFAKGAKNVIIKIGKDGAYICEENGDRYTLPTYSKYKPVDTTGAGDSFCAGFIAGLAHDLDYRTSGKIGNAVGTLCVMEVGASTGIRTWEETLRFMEENKDQVE